MKKWVIFTDLDGTLLDYRTYSFEAAMPALQELRDKDIPLVLCSSKTRSEIERYREKIQNDHPFISENGGGIFIPKSYFKSGIQNLEFRIRTEDGYLIITLGASYADLRKAVRELQAEGFGVRGFGDMTAEEVAKRTGISIDEAVMAKERDFDEPFVFEGDAEQAQRLLKAITAKGFRHTQGRFYHMLGDRDKGKAVQILIDLYRKTYGDVVSIAIGDSSNDIPMLGVADYPVVVQKPDGKYDSRLNVPNLIRAGGIGPDGWNKAVLRLIS
ncbi:MAG: HAD-IIB family hydrolase [Nitrospirota bacterium]